MNSRCFGRTWAMTGLDGLYSYETAKYFMFLTVISAWFERAGLGEAEGSEESDHGRMKNVNDSQAAQNQAPHADVDPAVSNWNLPNILTGLRILFIPLFVWLVLAGHDWWAFGCFALLMLTDKLDGDIARARGLITDFGKIADPIADKALMTAAFVSLNIIGALPVWITVVILFREFGITIWRFVLLRQGKVVPASKGGKLKTALQTLAVALYLCPLPEWMDIPSRIVMLAAVVVTVVTGVQYLVDGRKENQ